jgi:hypothetical protein
MPAKLWFPNSAFRRARFYKEMGYTDRAILLLKSVLEQKRTADDVLSYLVKLMIYHGLNVSTVCRDYLNRNIDNKKAPGLVLGLLDFNFLSPLEILAVCEDIAGLDPSQRDAIHRVYMDKLRMQPPGPPMTEEAAAMCGSAGWWPPEGYNDGVPDRLGEQRELFLIHASIDDGNELAAIEHLNLAPATGDNLVPLRRAWWRFINSECGRGAESRYAELAGRMAELYKQPGTR